MDMHRPGTAEETSLGWICIVLVQLKKQEEEEKLKS
jgi:hypothetical protein